MYVSFHIGEAIQRKASNSLFNYNFVSIWPGSMSSLSVILQENPINTLFARCFSSPYRVLLNLPLACHLGILFLDVGSLQYEVPRLKFPMPNMAVVFGSCGLLDEGTGERD